SFAYGYGVVVVQGVSMEPTFHNGQVLLMRRTHWPSAPLQYGDTVIFRQGDSFLVKRIAGLPGDPAPGLDDLTEPGTTPVMCPASVGAPGTRPLPHVPKGYLYVLGDNRPSSEDSRDFGPIRASAVVGRIVR